MTPVPDSGQRGSPVFVGLPAVHAVAIGMCPQESYGRGTSDTHGEERIAP